MKKFKKLALAVWMAIAVVCALLSAVSANGGLVNPKITAIPALLLMAFPVFAWVNILVGLLSLAFSRRAALVSLVGFLLSLYGLWYFCPLNLVRPSVDRDRDDLLKVMTYNVYEMRDYQHKSTDTNNRTAAEIIDSDADIVFVQEASCTRSGLFFHLPDSQAEALVNEYPYRVNRSDIVSIMSRTPLKVIQLPQPKEPYAGWVAAETVIDSDTFLLVSVHLQSILLTNSEKNNYWRVDGVARQRNSDLNRMRSIYRKLSSAFRYRAEQAAMLRSQLDSLGYRNVILAGDFNDISASYAQRTICRAGLHSAFADAGIGPMVTYHGSRLYFQIDHILYKGNFRAARVSRGSVKSSDHYPVYTTFILDR